MPQPNPTNPYTILANVLEQYDIFTKTGENYRLCIITVLQLTHLSLTTWLAHSKKKTCDVCKHPYSFTKGMLLCSLYTMHELRFRQCTRRTCLRGYQHSSLSGVWLSRLVMHSDLHSGQSWLGCFGSLFYRGPQYGRGGCSLPWETQRASSRVQTFSCDCTNKKLAHGGSVIVHVRPFSQPVQPIPVSLRTTTAWQSLQ